MLLHEKFIETAKEFSKKTAIVDITTGREVTYERALIGAIILSSRFRKFKDSTLGIMLPTSAGAVLSILGALMAGKVPVMINYSTGAQNNVLYAQEICNFHHVITSRRLLERVNCPEMKGMVFLEDIMDSIGKAEKLRAFAMAKMPPGLLKKRFRRMTEEDYSVILFTSGSEKEPKAVPLTHKNIMSNIEGFSEVFEFTSEDVMLSVLPYFHVFGLTAAMWTPLYHGMRFITYANPLDFQKVCEICREHRPTIMLGTPAFYWGYLKRSQPGDFQSVRLAVTGADKCPETLREAYLKKHNLVLLEGYGTTETSPVISANTQSENRPGSIGKPLPNVEVKIVDLDTEEELPPGKVGKILVRGDNVMKGYLNDIEETTHRLRHGWYDTGDMGWIDEDGFLWHAGRLKRFVKIGGEMVSLVKVEDVMERHLPDGVECCVVDVPDPVRGSRIVAAVTEEVDQKKVLKAIAKELPNIALPKEFVVIKDLPKMGSGKIDFRRTTEMVKEILGEK
ncbi:MAG: bifunctional acyl-ACP--phospholipid O-acyltransferase/long-chain-fatty-acid--ACP ligase [Nitrospirae bacterium]|nr:MAG: bifunctional acyl-ACP--phospholipid O-acyltransferase/long-chain-fatty-acid--ACP ligase [Nitrospirota bacterium]